jgi:transcriptional regulator with XRE-family HTH domain
MAAIVSRRQTLPGLLFELRTDFGTLLAMGREVPHDFWYRPDVAAYLADFDLPAVLAKISVEPGWSQEELARILNYSRPTLNKIVNGVRPLRVDEAKLIVRSLAIPPRLIGFGGGENEVDATDRRQFLKVTTLGATLTEAPRQPPISRAAGATDVARMREWIDTFRRMDNRWGGGHGLNQAVQYLKIEVLPTLSDARMSNEVRKELYSSSAQLFQLVGWMHYDINNEDAGQKALHNAFHLADQARDYALAAEVEAALSHQSAFFRKPDIAEDYATSAVRRARQSGLVSVQSEVAAMEAHAYALQGDARRTIRALQQAEDLFCQMRPTEVPEWHQY